MRTLLPLLAASPSLPGDGDGPARGRGREPHLEPRR